jgi:hypothetical protein
MRPYTKLYLSTLLSAAALLAVPFGRAQEKTGAFSASPPANFAYDVTKESVVQGTVISYTAASTVAPIGPHAKIQTSSGVVDVHLGSAQFLKQNDLVLNPGDSVKIVGQSMIFDGSPVVLARVLRKGNQTVTVRNFKGIPFLAKSPANAKPRVIVGGAR